VGLGGVGKRDRKGGVKASMQNSGDHIQSNVEMSARKRVKSAWGKTQRGGKEKRAEGLEEG